MKREKLPWLANNPFYTKRFSYYVGKKCRAMTVTDVAKELKLDWHSVKTLEKEYMQEQLRRNPVAAPSAIGIDEISLKKGHTYRIVVSDLERGRPIWFGGNDRLGRKHGYVLPVAWAKEDEEDTVSGYGYVEGI